VITTYTDNGDNNAREDWRRRALKKADCSFKKNGFVRFYKSGLVRFEKNGLCRFEKSVFFSPLKRRFVALKKAYFFVLRTVGCVYRGAMLRIESAGHQYR
jgi:hypothetical protein